MINFSRNKLASETFERNQSPFVTFNIVNRFRTHFSHFPSEYFEHERKLKLELIKAKNWVSYRALQNVSVWGKNRCLTHTHRLAVVVAQLVEQSLATPEVRGSKPVKVEFLFIYSLATVFKNSKKRPGMAHF